ncbi:MAG: GEVED domain-containing protein, partial [Reinekea sp.]|nr:GEVED domain-containing protein [Reinekea sp.]
YFASGNIIMSDIGNGLFTVKPDWDAINNPDPEPTTYCAAQGNDASYEWISNVGIGSFSNSSGSAKYSDFTGQSIALNVGSTAVSLAPGFRSSTYNEYWKIWIDLNGDGDFDDANEEVFSSGGLSKTTVTGNLTIPTGTAPLTTRLRVVMRYNAAPVACGSFNYGEVEDYTVVITDDEPPPPSDTYENTADFAIPDNNSTGISSPIVVDRTGNAGTVSVDVDITHTYIGDLIVDLIHPDGTVYNLHNRSGGSANDIQQTYSVNVGSKVSTGTWSLKVRDLANRDIGTLNLWRITF